MAKTAITEVSSSNTFQVWLDKTNELVDLIKTDVVTASLASSAGDTTIGNVTLEGIFTANTAIVQDLLRVDTISPKSGSTAVQVNSPVNIVTNQTVLERLSSTSGPRLSLFNTTDTDWQIGFENNTTKNFVISNGSNVFRLTGSGNLEITGVFSGTAQTANTVGLIATNTTDATHFPLFANTATGNAQVRSDTGFTYNPSTGVLTSTSFTGNLIGNVTGNVTGNAGTVTNGIYTSSTFNLGTTSIALNRSSGAQTLSGISIDGNAATVTNGVYITGNQTIGGVKTFSGTSTVFNGVNGIYGGTVYIGGRHLRLITADNRWEFVNATNTAVILTHTNTGDLTAAGNVTAYSDERLKSNIRTIDNALNKVNQMRGVYFDKDDKASTGVIAQEIEQILPEVVMEGEYKSVAYGNIVGILIEAIKELKSEIEELKHKETRYDATC